MFEAVIVCGFIGIPLLAVLGFHDCYRRAWWRTRDIVHERPSIARALATSMMAARTAGDWNVEDGARQTAVNQRLGVFLACYRFTLKVWFEWGGDGVVLKPWEQHLIRRAIRQRVKQAKRDRTLSSMRAHDEAIVRLADRFVENYER